MSKFPVICVGAATVDQVFELENIPTKAVKLRAESRQMRGGGPAAAVACAALGAPAEFWGRDPEGEFLKGLLARARVGVDGIVDTDGRRLSRS
jgi:sugar/nucleoside kinase (ribokinase family)